MMSDNQRPVPHAVTPEIRERLRQRHERILQDPDRFTESGIETDPNARLFKVRHAGNLDGTFSQWVDDRLVIDHGKIIDEESLTRIGIPLSLIPGLVNDWRGGGQDREDPSGPVP
jgi:hypothetical protein